MRLAKFEITSDLLCSILKLPPGTRIVDIRNGRMYGDGIAVEALCVSPEFPEVADGETVPTKTPWYRTDGKGGFEFDGWK